MKDFVKKLISRLEKERDEYKLTEDEFEDDYGGRIAMDLAISIVNELAEEYKSDWIPCSERLPYDFMSFEYLTIKMDTHWQLLVFIALQIKSGIYQEIAQKKLLFLHGCHFLHLIRKESSYATRNRTD